MTQRELEKELVQLVTVKWNNNDAYQIVRALFYVARAIREHSDSTAAALPFAGKGD